MERNTGHGAGSVVDVTYQKTDQRKIQKWVESSEIGQLAWQEQRPHCKAGYVLKDIQELTVTLSQL